MTANVLILDFGSQVTQLIARRVRENGVYCEIHPFNKADEAIAQLAPAAIILSGGPASVTADDGPRVPGAVFGLGVPVLGICYGQQSQCVELGGSVESSDESLPPNEATTVTTAGSAAVRAAQIDMGRPGRDRAALRADLARDGLATPLHPPVGSGDRALGLLLSGAVGRLAGRRITGVGLSAFRRLSPCRGTCGVGLLALGRLGRGVRGGSRLGHRGGYRWRR